MTVNKAIQKARYDVTENGTYDEGVKAIWEMSCPLGCNPIIWLRDRRIAYALELLGVDPEKANAWCDQQGSFTELVHDYFRNKEE